ncbi:MAG: hypothetical protein AAGK14_10080 [Verrucomicrobiota bacterium]
MARTSRTGSPLGDAMARLSPQQWYGVAAVLAAVLVGLTVWDLYRDDPPPEDADILVEPSTIGPPETNGLIMAAKLMEEIDRAGDLEQLSDLIDFVDDPADTDWDEVALELEPLHGHFDRIDEVIAAPHFTDLRLQSREDISGLSAALRLSNLLAYRMGSARAQGHSQQVWIDSMRCVRLGDRLIGKNLAIVAQLIGQANQAIGLGEVRESVVDLAPDAATARLRNDELKRYEPVAQDLKDSLLFEYYLAKRYVTPQFIEDTRRDYGMLAPILFKPNRTMRVLGGQIKAMFAQLGRPTTQFTPPPDPPASGIVNHYGNYFFACPFYTAEDHNHCRAQFAFTRVGLALAGYANERDGELPASLEELVPAYIDAIPVDPVDGQPLRYDRERRRTWSIGPDAKDQDGLSYAEWEEAGLPGPPGGQSYDIVMKIPMPPDYRETPPPAVD